MPLHPHVAKALRKIIKAEGQPESVTKRLEAWLNQMADDSQSLGNRDEVLKNIENVLTEIVLSSDTEDEVDE
jgi:hypothetical protein